MSATQIEPGLLNLFRWFVAIRLGYLALVWLSVRNGRSVETEQVPGPGIVMSVALLLYLGSPNLQRRLGKAYLPVALAVASIGPIIEHAAAVSRRLDAGESVNDAVADYWLLFFVLLAPLILTAWQYRFRVVVLFTAVVTMLDGARLGGQLDGTNSDLSAVGALLVGRALVFLFVGYFITKIVGVQRQQQRALRRYAATVEQLATSRERNRLARELHDTLAHTLSALAVQLEGARSLWERDPERARSMLDRSLEGARSGLEEARRAIVALRASVLEELGLAGALQKLAADLSATSSVVVRTKVVDPGVLEPSIEQAIYRISEEALANVVRHAEATEATLALARSGGELELVVHDNGAGFDSSSPVDAGHHGLSGMRERAGLAGGRFVVESAPGSGTTVRFAVGVAS